MFKSPLEWLPIILDILIWRSNIRLSNIVLSSLLSNFHKTRYKLLFYKTQPVFSLRLLLSPVSSIISTRSIVNQRGCFSNLLTRRTVVPFRIVEVIHRVTPSLTTCVTRSSQISKSRRANSAPIHFRYGSKAICYRSGEECEAILL